MDNIFTTLSITSPIFITIFIGYLVVKFRWMPKENVRSLAWFVVNIGLPAALFKALSSREFKDILHYDYLIVFGLGSLLSFSLLFFIARYRNKSLTESALFGLGASISNSLLIGFPIVIQLYGEHALVPFALTLIVENLLILPLTLALADTGQQKNIHFLEALKKSLSQLTRNPIIISIGIGIASAIIGFKPPQVVSHVIDVLSLSVAGVSLIAIGGMLVDIKVKGMMSDISTIVLGKLILHPLCVFIFVLMFPSMPLISKQVAIIIACMPMFSIFAVIGMKYNYGQLCSATLLPASILSFVTINLMIWLISSYSLF